MKSSTAFTFFSLIPASLQLEPNSEPPRMLSIATTPLNSCANARNKGEKNGTSDTLLLPYPDEEVIVHNPY